MTLKATQSAAGEAATPATEETGLPPLETGAPPAERTTAAETPESQTATGAEGQDGEPEAATEGQEDKAKSKNRVSFKERIQQITRRSRLTERERDRALERAERAETENRRLMQRLNGQELSPEERQAAEVERTLNNRDARQARQEAASLNREAEVEEHNGRVEAFAELVDKDTRFPNLIREFNRVPVTPVMARFIMRSEDPVAMANYMAQSANRDEVEDLIDLMQPDRRGRPPRAEDVEEAMDRFATIRAKLKAAPPARTTTNAPAPGTTLKGKSPPGQQRSLEERADNMDDFAPALLKKLGLTK